MSQTMTAASMTITATPPTKTGVPNSAVSGTVPCQPCLRAPNHSNNTGAHQIVE